MLCSAGGGLGLSLPMFLNIRSATAATSSGKAKSCIVLYCWGGMSHHEVFDPRPDAPVDVRGEFSPISTAVPGIIVGEHIPRLAKIANRLAIVRSVNHGESAHGRGMYWNLTGHAPPPIPAGNIPPTREQWPSLTAMVSKIRAAPKGVPGAVRLPYPLVDNGTLQGGEYGGWLGVPHDPIVMKTPAGTAWGGVSRSLGAEVLDLKNNVALSRAQTRRKLVASLERPISVPAEFEEFEHFRELASDMLLSSAVRNAYNLDAEDVKTRDTYGMHIGGQSMLLARRLVEAGVPIVQVCCAAGDLNGGKGDMWDTHGDNFRRLKDRLLPVFDRAMSALILDLEQRGMLDETLVVMLTDFGRTPKINGAAGRDHYPNVYSVAMAGGGIRGGQVYGSSDTLGAFPRTSPCSPADLHATIFQSLGISPRAEIHDQLGRPFPVSDGRVLPLM
ncbi:MAG: DUF1501 domain-containing protein [Pirellulaceae bacterium]